VSDHTKEPWVIRNGCIFSDQRMHAIVVLGTNKVDTANAKRIGACVNALAGIPNSALEAGIIKEMVETLGKSSQALRLYRPESPTAESIDNLLAKLEEK